MKNKALLRTIVIIFLAFVAGWVIFKLILPQPQPSESFQPSPFIQQPAGGGPGQGFGQIVHMLNLTKEQTAAFADNENRYRAETQALVAKIDSLDQEIISELTKNNPDEVRLAQMAQESGKVQQAIKENTIEHFMVLRDICTPAQLSKYKEVFEQLNQFRQGRGPGHGWGRGRGRNRGWQNR